MYKVLDLFAGAGGMSLGFLQTGNYEIAVAVEKHPHTQATYKHNHRDTELLGDILEITDYISFQQQYGSFDIVVGGPPCQGFSNANRQRNHLISQNNSLVKKYIEVIENIKPKAFVMENVRMLSSEIHRFYRSKNDELDFEELGITTRGETLQLMDNNCGVNDLSDFLLNLEIVNELILPKNIFDVLRIVVKGSYKIEKRAAMLEKKRKACIKAVDSVPQRNARISNNYIAVERDAMLAFKQYASGNIPFEAVQESVANYINLQRLLLSSKELLDNNIIIDDLKIDANGIFVNVQSYSVIDYISKKLGSAYQIDSDVLNAASFGAPQFRQRYIAVGLRKDLLQANSIHRMLPEEEYKPEEYRIVSDAISDLDKIIPSFNINEEAVDLVGKSYKATVLTKYLRNSNKLYNHVVTDSTETAKKRFAALQPGQNFHDLEISLIEDTYTGPERTQNSIYLRLDYCKPCGTVTNVRKSMWIHPTIDRAISVREAARLQTFPDSFEFFGSKDSQYQQVGNAVPPIMARAIAAKLSEILDVCCQNQSGGGEEHGGHLHSGATPPCDVKDTFQEYESRNDRQEISA